MKLKVLVADDNPAFLSRLVSLLEGEFDVVCTAENGQMALERAQRYLPDVAVVDLEMPFLNGIAVTRRLKESAPSVGVVICSVEMDAEVVEGARQAGALGYVFKTHMMRDLVEAVKSAARNQPFVSAP
jgi:two-component system response regulator NreC